jgi:virginiamycin A acetyltransferase
MKYYLKKILRKLLSFYSEDYYIDNLSTIEKNTFLGKNVAITKSKIGSYCSIAPGVLIGMGEHDINKISTSSIFYDNPYEELTKDDCIIEHDVWIGVNAIILRGVTIGTGAVIGAGTIVTKDVPEFAVVVGVPAKVIKYRFDELKRKRILESKWWEYDKVDASRILKGLM